MTKLELVKEKLDKVSPEDLDSVNELIDKILTTNKNPEIKKMKLHLGGALKELSDKYTSVQLQHKASDWIVEDALNYKKK